MGVRSARQLSNLSMVLVSRYSTCRRLIITFANDAVIEYRKHAFTECACIPETS